MTVQELIDILSQGLPKNAEIYTEEYDMITPIAGIEQRGEGDGKYVVILPGE